MLKDKVKVFNNRMSAINDVYKIFCYSTWSRHPISSSWALLMLTFAELFES